jgi:hypothetical protein
MKPAFERPRQTSDVEHSVVYRNEREFCGWPYTSGFWRTGHDELIAAFRAIDVDYQDAAGLSHDALVERGATRRLLTVRSMDLGASWSDPEAEMFDNIAQPSAAMSAGDLEPVDYLDPDTLVATRSVRFCQPDARSTYQVSKDSGRTWSSPMDIPLEGLNSLSAINSYLVRPDGRCLVFLIEVDKSGWNRRPVVYASSDDGTEYHFLSFITPKADPWAQAEGDYSSTFRFGGHRWFYTKGVMLANGRILVSIRCQRDPRGIMWTDVYGSDDGGRTWEFVSRANDFGAPGNPVVLDDGRIVITYGYRLKPSGIRYVVSEDEGRTWGPERIVRDDGGSWDLGYPNSWDAGNGKVGVLYYFNSKDDPTQANGGVRHIAQSIFAPE